MKRHAQKREVETSPGDFSLSLWCDRFPSHPSWTFVRHLRFFLCSQSPSTIHLPWIFQQWRLSSTAPQHFLVRPVLPDTWAGAVFLLPDLLATRTHPSAAHNIARKMSSKGNFSPPKPLKDLLVTPKGFPGLGDPYRWQFWASFWRLVVLASPHKIPHHQARSLSVSLSIAILLSEKFAICAWWRSHSSKTYWFPFLAKRQ